MLDVLPFAPLRLGDVLAQRPERRRLLLRLGERHVAHAAAVEGVGERGLDLGAERGARAAVVGLHQGIPGVVGQGIGEVGVVLAAQAQGYAGDELESDQPVAERGLELFQQAHAGGCVGQRSEGGDPFGRAREELQHGGGDDAERSFGADEELLQVVAGVVLAQSAQAVPHSAIGKHHLEAQHQVAGIAEAQHARCRRRWWKGCRRSCSCPPHRATAGRRSPRPRRLPAPAPAARPPRRSGWRCRGRPRARG